MIKTDMVDRQAYNAMEYLACVLASALMNSEGWCKDEFEAEMRWELLACIQINDELEDIVRRLAKLTDDRYPFLKRKDDE